MLSHVNYHQLNISLLVNEVWNTESLCNPESRFSREKMLFSPIHPPIIAHPPMNEKKKKVKRRREHKKRTRSRDRYPEDRRWSRRDRSLTRYCMTATTIVGGFVYGFVDLNEIESVIPCREHRRHLYEDAQEDLPFPFSRFLRRISRSLARSCSGEEHSPPSWIPHRPRILAPPRNPKRASNGIPEARRLLLTWWGRVVDVLPQIVRANSIHRRAN